MQEEDPEAARRSQMEPHCWHVTVEGAGSGGGTSVNSKLVRRRQQEDLEDEPRKRIRMRHQCKQKFKVQSSKFKKFKVQSSKFKVQMAQEGQGTGQPEPDSVGNSAQKCGYGRRY